MRIKKTLKRVKVATGGVLIAVTVSALYAFNSNDPSHILKLNKNQENNS